jgi:hypothetical protein
LTKSTRKWLHGLSAAFVGTVATSIDSSVTLTLIAPETFNLNHGLKKTLVTVLVLSLLSGVKTAMAYLKQAPVPPAEDEPVPAQKAAGVGQ